METYWDVSYRCPEMDKITPSRRNEIEKKIKRLQSIPECHGIPLLSNMDKKLHRCFETKAKEMRIIYCYDKSKAKLHVLAVGERSKKEVYRSAYHNLQKL